MESQWKEIAMAIRVEKQPVLRPATTRPKGFVAARLRAGWFFFEELIVECYRKTG